MVLRVVPPELEHREWQKRRTLRLRPQGRSLDNCNHLGTSATKPLAVALLEAKRLVWKRAARIRLWETLCSTLFHIAVLEKSKSDHEAWEDAPQSNAKGAWSASRDWRRVDHCQKEWRAFRASCCDSPVVAVPIRCDHRLCPLCGAERLERYRGPVRRMLEAMENPAFLTLTVPNVGRLTHATFREIRGYWKAFQKQNANYLRGGIYAIEVTYNREARTWHPHLHIIFDSPYRISGIGRATFREAKRRLEFSWLRITSHSARRVFKRGEFERWQLEAAQQARGSVWNRTYRRVVDVRSVKPGDGAVYECIKYISKSTRFLDMPDAVGEFLRAVRGVRVTQTFGCFYNWKLDDDDDDKPLEGDELRARRLASIDTLGETVAPEKTFLTCNCGQNKFHNVGIFSRSHVRQELSGRWVVDPRALRRYQRCREHPNPPPKEEFSWQ